MIRGSPLEEIMVLNIRNDNELIGSVSREEMVIVGKAL